MENDYNNPGKRKLSDLVKDYVLRKLGLERASLSEELKRLNRSLSRQVARLRDTRQGGTLHFNTVMRGDLYGRIVEKGGLLITYEERLHPNISESYFEPDLRELFRLLEAYTEVKRVVKKTSLEIHSSIGSQGGTDVIPHTDREVEIRHKSLADERLGISPQAQAEYASKVVQISRIMKKEFPDAFVASAAVEHHLLSRGVAGDKLYGVPFDVTQRYNRQGIELMKLDQIIKETIGEENYEPIDVRGKIRQLGTRTENGQHVFSLGTMFALEALEQEYLEHSIMVDFDRGPPNAIYTQDSKIKEIDWLRTVDGLWLPNYNQVQIVGYWTVERMMELGRLLDADTGEEDREKKIHDYLINEAVAGPEHGEELFGELEEHSVQEIGSLLMKKLKEDGDDLARERTYPGLENDEQIKLMWELGFVWFSSRRILYGNLYHDRNNNWSNTEIFNNYKLLLESTELEHLGAERVRTSIIGDLEQLIT